MDNRAVICTHHKTGTIWMRHTFEATASALNVPCVRISAEGADVPLPRSACFVRDVHSQWFSKRFHENGDRILHVIRDPRDIVISAMHYHRKSPEKWLHRPDDRFGGMTYQQALNGLPDDRSRMIFEMDHSSAAIIRRMCAWQYGRWDCFETKYETLLASGGDEFAKAAQHLGLRGTEVDVAVSSFCENSLASGAQYKIGSDVHVRSGAPEQWREVYDAELEQAFTDRFPDSISRLGYPAF